MSLVISHKSALEYWRSVRVGKRRYVEVARARNLILKPPLDYYGEKTGPWWLSRPLHVLVGDAKVRRSPEGVVSHVWGGSLPKGSVLETGNGFFVCSPALTFLQMAKEQSFLDTIKLGLEFCGTYDCLQDAMQSCAPLCSEAHLRSFVNSMEGVRGRENAQKALRYIAQNSASPRESLLVMLLCLPYKWGGYGLPVPKLNFRIEVSARAKTKARKNYYICDLYWPDEKLAVEYDSDSFHASPGQIANDSARRIALEAMGIKMLAITRRQMDSVAELDDAARFIAKRLGKRLRYPKQEFALQRLRLRTELLREG